MPTMFITRVAAIRAPTAPIERNSPLTAPILCSSASGSAALVGVSLDEARSDPHETLPSLDLHGRGTSGGKLFYF